MVRISKEQLEEILAQKDISLKDMCARTGYTQQGLQNVLGRYKMGVSFSLQEEFVHTRRNQRYDALIAVGLSGADIARQTGCKRQNIHQYIKRTRQQKFWHHQREIFRHDFGGSSRKEGITLLPSFQKNYLWLLEEYITHLCREKSFAYQKAWEILRDAPKNRSQKFEELVQFFERYYSARQRRVKLSLAELGEYFDWDGMTVRHLLYKVGLTPMYGKCPIPSRQEAARKQEIILNCFDSPLSAEDIAYFAGIKRSSVSQYFQKKGPRAVVKCHLPLSNARGSGKVTERIFTYRLFSRIYEANDAGCSEAEIAEYAPSTPKIIAQVLEHRVEIEPIIIQALQQLYSKEEFTAPYRNKYGIM